MAVGKVNEMLHIEHNILILDNIYIYIKYHFHLLGVIGVAVIGLNERSTSIEDGRHHQTEREHIAGSADRRLRLHFRRWVARASSLHVRISYHRHNGG